MRDEPAEKQLKNSDGAKPDWMQDVKSTACEMILFPKGFYSHSHDIDTTVSPIFGKDSALVSSTLARPAHALVGRRLGTDVGYAQRKSRGSGLKVALARWLQW